MESWSVFECVAESAIFLHGPIGDGGRFHERAEFRGAALKGALRYWFRAVAGRALSVSELQRIESLVFGDSVSFGGRLEVRFEVDTTYTEATAPALRLPHKVVEGVEEPASAESPEAKDAKRGRKRRPERKKTDALLPQTCIRPGVKFRIKLRRFDSSDQGKELLNATLGSLWLALNLGGLGNRKRRGAGSVSVVGAESSVADFPVWENTGDESAFVEYLKRGVRWANEQISHALALHSKPSDGQGTGVPVLALDSDIHVSRIAAPNESDARKSLMLSLREFKNPAFGMPLRLQRASAEGSETGAVEKVSLSNRHASPLWLRLVSAGSDWFVVATLLRPLPDGPEADASRVSDFLISLKGGKFSPAEVGVI